MEIKSDVFYFRLNRWILYEIFLAGNISKICVKIQVTLNMTFVFPNLLWKSITKVITFKMMTYWWRNLLIILIVTLYKGKKNNLYIRENISCKCAYFFIRYKFVIRHINCNWSDIYGQSWLLDNLLWQKTIFNFNIRMESCLSNGGPLSMQRNFQIRLKCETSFTCIFLYHSTNYQNKINLLCVLPKLRFAISKRRKWRETYTSQ